ncbi:glycosyltransferase family 2 protein [Fimbriiglobus ruber]|uniref:Glycosyl transferase, family 2 n=1 Tax=Fimbriiglobus ruber TaxID=1908690 RepID=A0A225DX84_9BACT|nr:glycosyltransferase [Fimbriiglobus ruber]OWK40777.1 Glycosyl transferase, family 2 precursor [Fimbriiglobus ruber]
MTVVLICTLFLAAATAACLYYAVLTTLGWLAASQPGEVAAEPRHAFTVLIPAHDEEQGLPATVHSALAADYPTAKRRVLVVADNCSDRTAEVARAAGAECVERYDDDLRGKGYALAYAMPYALGPETDAVVVIDADCELAADALHVLDAALTRGAAVAQSAVISRNPQVQPAGLVAMVGSVIENGVSAGLDRLGMAVPLRGTGMVFRRDVLERFPWTAFGLTEDAEYGAKLAAAGERVRFVANALVRSEAPPDTTALYTQRRRWRTALFSGGQSWVHRAFRSKPLVLTHLFATAVVTSACAGMGWLSPAWEVGLGAWAVALLGLTCLVYLRAMRRADQDASGVLGLWRAAVVVTRLAWVTAAGLVKRSATWERTPRATRAVAP